MTTAERPLRADPPGRGLWVGLALGLPVMGWGVLTAVELSERVRPADLTRWIVGSALVHDLVVLPIVLVVGTLLRRVVPAAAWPPVRWALATSAVAALVAWPFVRGDGRSPEVPSALDRPYGTGLLVLVGAVWAVALVWAVVAIRARGRRRAPDA